MSDKPPYTDEQVEMARKAWGLHEGGYWPRYVIERLDRLHAAGITLNFPEPPEPKWKMYESLVNWVFRLNDSTVTLDAPKKVVTTTQAQRILAVLNEQDET
jgi:hypothetical protein